MAKYELTEITRRLPDGTMVRRIRALEKINTVEYSVSPGDLGGWIEYEDNLSHEGTCWVDGEAIVSGLATVSEDALICGYARIKDQANVRGKAVVTDFAIVCEEADVSGAACIQGFAIVSGRARITEHVSVRGGALVTDEVLIGGDKVIIADLAVAEGSATVEGRAIIDGCSVVSGNSKISGNCCITGCATVDGNASISGNCHIFGGAVVEGDVQLDSNVSVCSDAYIADKSHYLTIQPCALSTSKMAAVTFFRNRKGDIKTSSTEHFLPATTDCMSIAGMSSESPDMDEETRDVVKLVLSHIDTTPIPEAEPDRHDWGTNLRDRRETWM